MNSASFVKSPFSKNLNNSKKTVSDLKFGSVNSNKLSSSNKNNLTYNFNEFNNNINKFISKNTSNTSHESFYSPIKFSTSKPKFGLKELEEATRNKNKGKNVRFSS